MSPDCELYRDEEGCIAVLVSPGYGAGWSTWNDKRLAYDRRIVEYILENGAPERNSTEAFKSFVESLGYHDVYMGGAYQLEIKWAKPGSYIRINEYDGSEALEVLDPERSYILLK